MTATLASLLSPEELEALRHPPMNTDERGSACACVDPRFPSSFPHCTAWMTVAKFAEAFDLLEESVHWLIAVGQLQAKTIGDYLVVNAADYRLSAPSLSVSSVVSSSP